MDRDTVQQRLVSQLTHISRAGSGDELAGRAAWLNGFLYGSELLLIHDLVLWGLLNSWVAGLTEPQFRAILPLLRRSFSQFSQGARQQLRERARRRPAPVAGSGVTAFDPAQGKAVMPLLALILGKEDTANG